jgi:hypothetical protein
MFLDTLFEDDADHTSVHISTTQQVLKKILFANFELYAGI